MARIDAARRIVRDHQAEEVEGTLLDAFSANAYVTVFDALSDGNREKLEAAPLRVAMKAVWTVLKPREA